MTTMTSATPLNGWQRRIVAVSWITYAAYYLCRVNISTALPDLQRNLHLTNGQAGLITTGFFWAYALGQIINGRLGDRVSPRRLILVGMLVSAGLNIAFGSLSQLPLLILVWAINGYFQATGWGPVLRTLANWLTPVQRTRVSVIFGSCFVAGNALTWLLTGWLVANFGWRTAFWIPASLMTMIALGWYLLARDKPEPDGPLAPIPDSPAAPLNWMLLINDLFISLRRYWQLVAASIFFGFTFVSLIVWLPTYYVEVRHLNIGTAAIFSTLVPGAGIIGTFVIGGWIGRYWQGREVMGLTLTLVVLAALLGLYPFLPGDLVTGILVLLVIGSIAYGATSVLLTTMPLTLGSQGEASSTAGLLDLSFNIGGGLSGGIIGLLLDAQGWNAVFLAQGATVLIASLFLIALSRTPKGA